MSSEVEIKIPAVGESITEVFIGEWYVDKGTFVELDGNVVGLETDKATFDVPAPVAGTITKVLKEAGDTAEIGEVIGYMEKGEAPAASKAAAVPDAKASGGGHVMPAAERAMEEANLPAGSVAGSGPSGRVLKEDVARHVQSGGGPKPMTGSRETKSVPMSPIRQTIASRLVNAQQTAALLTTFNEIDMLAVKEMRQQYKDDFEKKYGTKLGFMSFFVKAIVDALQEYPAINAQMDGNKLIYHNYCDVGIAVGGGKGLVVPVLRNAENMSFAEIEQAIRDFGARAQKNQISLDELEGGTFTVTNGGVYGSLLSTPIVNPPQSGVLGMHGIVDRPIAVNGEVVIRPMMYVALTYDHRVVDGKEAVTFLKRIKDVIEDPARLVLEV
ncbi:2-oxoglutarate dehydrogenase complex dihydrolipoyllysine-residue succinyltransferase [Fuerstiella marisgermanici]|uniref:Dihydrolipoyllysine-residue succinyltransferase component of 2-oxoglutarate dehydrogenase complex n=1 Tax=Fuerstiella marisgermanici TaxID=1891926 RepID=A0A1P8WSG3_9PLAN|nr:2-oxoglutarate dehydrogenase complex dihydrolipoyllysine-residue succinyltransferase [Fuerstiella marisgermanici]APZ96998.1 Dihydrolipoyllysine-residue succinyltransferase component of 2-oxoglutarate dehydrogenase complex [Fuerstiella marisgermanici]